MLRYEFRLPSSVLITQSLSIIRARVVFVIGDPLSSILNALVVAPSYHGLVEREKSYSVNQQSIDASKS